MAAGSGRLGLSQRAVRVRDADRELAGTLAREAQILEVPEVKRLEAPMDHPERNARRAFWAHGRLRACEPPRPGRGHDAPVASRTLRSPPSIT